MANYTGTDWQPETKISTDIMATIDEGLGEVNADLTDKLGKFSISGGNLTSTAPLEFSYSDKAIIFLFRGSGTHYGLYAFDAWNATITFITSNSVSIENNEKNVTITSNVSQAMRYILIKD